MDDKKSFLMSFYEHRLASYTKSWPFQSDCECTPQKMAEAGFYHCPTDTEPDVVICAYCLKALDGWEPSDDPWEEHKSHSGHCPFLKIANPKEMTVKEFLWLQKERHCIIVSKDVDREIDEFQKFADNAKQELNKLKDI